MIGRDHDDDPIDEARLMQAPGEGESEGGLAGARGRRDEKVLGLFGLVLLEGLPLPKAQFPGSHAHLFPV